MSKRRHISWNIRTHPMNNEAEARFIEVAGLEPGGDEDAELVP